MINTTLLFQIVLEFSSLLFRTPKLSPITLILKDKEREKKFNVKLGLQAVHTTLAGLSALRTGVSGKINSGGNQRAKGVNDVRGPQLFK